MDLSVIIPARNEIFAAQTANNVLDKAKANTEVLLVLDGYWPDPVIHDRPNLRIIHNSEPVGQRAATNQGARLSNAKYVMKLDAHCSVAEGFDLALMEDCQPDWVMIPSQYNLHAFDWVCEQCGKRRYQGSKPAVCKECGGEHFEMRIVWKRRRNRLTVSWRFDSDLHFQYWKEHKRRPEVQSQGDLIETMSCIGACIFCERERYWQLGGMDEEHGSWGQFGTEIACKSWLSGGKLITSLKTWYAHMFRTGNFAANGESTWPYEITQRQINAARAYSQTMWRDNAWPGQVKPLSWMLEHFWPVPDWTDEQLAEQKKRESNFTISS